MSKENKEKQKEEVQKLYVQQQLIKHQVSAYTEQANIVEARISEIVSTIETIKALKELESGNETLTNIGSQAFIKSEIKDTKRVVVEIGSGIFQKKDIKNALLTLEERKNELFSIHNQIAAEISKLNFHLQQIEPELRKLVENLQE